MRHPDWYTDALVQVVDIRTEQSAGQKIQGCILSTWLARRRDTVLPEPRIDILAAPGSPQEIANDFGQRQGSIEVATPAETSQEGISARNRKRGAGRASMRGLAGKTRRTHQRDAFEGRGRCDGGPGQKFGRQ